MDAHADDSSTDPMPNSDGHGARTGPQTSACGKPVAAGAQLRRARRRWTRSSATTVMHAAPTGAPSGSASPCGACKFLRRRCVSGCVFAPHFGSEQGAARFAAVHKVFGASNASKLLHHVPVARRGDAVMSICYEAQARLSDPVFGCVSTIIALQQQMHLVSSRTAAETAARCSQQQQQHVIALQPASSNNSAASNNLPSWSCSFPSGLGYAGAAAASPSGYGTLRLSQPSSQADGVGDGVDVVQPGYLCRQVF